MRRSTIVALCAFAVLTTLVVFGQADAIQSTKAIKIYELSITVTPSPAPVAYSKHAPATASADERGLAFARAFTHASAPSDVVAPDLEIAQVPPVATSPVPVQFVAKPDPNALYLRIIPHVTSISAPYGPSTYPCAFEVYTYWTKTYTLNDWSYGTPNGSPTFPLESYPATSYLSYAIPDFGPTIKAFANNGAAGQITWTGNAAAQQHCIDLSLNVPSTQAPTSGTNPPYSAAVQYTLVVTF